VVASLRAEFGRGLAEVEFVAVCDATKQRSETLNGLNNAQVRVGMSPELTI
jgi:hypothetical protein